MAEPKETIERWFNTLPPGTRIGIDGGGLALEAVCEHNPTLEIGSAPYDEEDAWAVVYTDCVIVYHPQICNWTAMKYDGPVPGSADEFDAWAMVEDPEGIQWDCHMQTAERGDQVDVWIYPVRDGKTDTSAHPLHTTAVIHPMTLERAQEIFERASHFAYPYGGPV